MTANVYQYFDVLQFPELELNKDFVTNHQDSILHEVDETPHSIIRYLGYSDLPSCKKYHVIHEVFKKTQGRLKNETISGYIEQINFHIFINENRLLINSTNNISKELLKRIRKTNDDFRIEASKIDLISFSEDLRNNIRGGWFGNLKVADVTSIGMFGPTVGESDEWERYNKKGDLKAINVQFYGQNETILFQITKNRGIVHYDKRNESEILRKLLEVQKILDGYITK